MPYRQNFIDALLLIANAAEAMAAKGLSRPVLVGGAAVELWTGSAVTTGDFDFVTENQQVFEDLLIKRGFVRPGGIGVSLRGLDHPELKIGVEVVSGPLFDGAVPADRVALVPYDSGTLAVISVEDAIADRMGQYASHEQSNQEMLEQAQAMLQIATITDQDYLDRRIQEETAGCYNLAFLREMTSHRNEIQQQAASDACSFTPEP